MRPRLQLKSNDVAYSERVFIAFGIQHVKWKRPSGLSSVSFLPVPCCQHLIKGTIFGGGGGDSEIKVCVMIFLANFVGKHLSLKGC